MYTVLLYDEGAQGATELGGGQLARLSLMECLNDDFDPVLLTSNDGELASEARARGLSVIVRDITGSLPRFKRTNFPKDPSTLTRFLFGFPRAVIRFRKAVKSIEPDIIHPNENLSRLITTIALWRSGIPKVTHIDTEWNTGILDPLMRRLFVGSFDRLIAVSEAVGNLLDPHGTRPENVVTIHPGIELDRFDQIGTPATPFPETEDHTVITTVGSLIPIKGHEYLFDALKQLERNEVLCLVVGSGPRQATLEKLVAEQGLDDTVHFLGFRSDIPEIFSRTDISVTPSLSEAFPRVVLEAMATGVPVVASDVGGVSEAVVDGKTGFLVPSRSSSALTDAIETLLEDPGLQRSFGQNGRQRVREQFSFDQGVARVESLYRQLL